MLTQLEVGLTVALLECFTFTAKHLLHYEQAHPDDIVSDICQVGLHTAIKPLLSHSTTGKFNSPPEYLRIPRVRVEPYFQASATHPNLP